MASKDHSQETEEEGAISKYRRKYNSLRNQLKANRIKLVTAILLLIALTFFSAAEHYKPLLNSETVPILTSHILNKFADAMVVAAFVGITYEWYLDSIRQEEFNEVAKKAAEDTVNEAEISSDFDADLEEIKTQLEPNIVFVGGPNPNNTDAPQRRVNEFLINHINEQQSSKIDMLEYSSQTVTQVIREAAELGMEIRLLVKSPRTALPDRQLGYIVYNGIDDIYMRIHNYEDLSIRMYREPASLRGRKIDDELINLGWYTYDRRENRDSQIWGSQNSMVIVQRDEPEEYAALDDLFQAVFENMWKSSYSLLDEYQHEKTLSEEEDTPLFDWVQDSDTSQKEEWVKRVTD